MIIERTKDEIIIRLPGNIDIDELQDFTDWFRYKELTGNQKPDSQMSTLWSKRSKKDDGTAGKKC
jgi:hypothetical protein